MASAFIEHLHDLFAALGPITTRAMFGGHGVYFDGLIIGIVIDDALYLKADEQTRALFEAAGCAPFVYRFDQNRSRQPPITMSYWSLPEDAMESPQAMLPWAKLAFEAALRKPRSSKQARKPVK